jgi:hypothetical protein
MSMKSSNDTIGNRTRNLPVCSTVPQPTAPPRAPPLHTVMTNKTDIFPSSRPVVQKHWYQTTRFEIRSSIFQILQSFSNRFMSLPTCLLIFIYRCADLLLLWAEHFYTTWLLRGTSKFFFALCIIKIFTMKIEKFQLRGNNSVCAWAFQLPHGRAPLQLRGNNGY